MPDGAPAADYGPQHIFFNLARYNQSANQAMLKILASLISQILDTLGRPNNLADNIAYLEPVADNDHRAVTT